MGLTSFGRINEKDVTWEQSRVEELFSRKGDNGLCPWHIKKNLNKIMWESVGLVRNETNLKAARNEFDRMEHEYLSRIILSTHSKRYNREFIETFELMNLLKVAKLIAMSALQRTESRGAHFREDFPKKDNETWLKHVNIIYRNFSMQVRESTVNMAELKRPDSSADMPEVDGNVVVTDGHPG